jgi:histidinol-phosphate aminotransferase
VTVDARRSLEEVGAYEPVEQEGLNLSDNANLFEPNPAIERGLDAIEPEEVRDYPSGYGDALRERIAELHGTAADRVVTANGSSDLLDLLVRAFADPGDRVAYHPPSFSMIPIWTRCNAAETLPVPLGDGFGLDVEAFAEAEAPIGVVCRPNNPTGNAFALEEVEQVAEAFAGLLVVDEAYVRFAEVPDAAHLADRDDVVVTRSLSKDAGLAGLRFGYGLADPDIVATLRKVRGPFRVPRTTEAIALEALDDLAHVERVAKTVQTERERVRERVRELGLTAFPTQANFVLVEAPWPGARVADALAERGVLVRALGSDALEACFRVTVGPRATNDRFLDALEDLIDAGGP